jgi:hypothetical protein
MAEALVRGFTCAPQPMAETTRILNKAAWLQPKKWLRGLQSVTAQFHYLTAGTVPA